MKQTSVTFQSGLSVLSASHIHHLPPKKLKNNSKADKKRIHDEAEVVFYMDLAWLAW